MSLSALPQVSVRPILLVPFKQRVPLQATMNLQKLAYLSATSLMQRYTLGN